MEASCASITIPYKTREVLYVPCGWFCGCCACLVWPPIQWPVRGQSKAMEKLNIDIQMQYCIAGELEGTVVCPPMLCKDAGPTTVQAWTPQSPQCMQRSSTCTHKAIRCVRRSTNGRLAQCQCQCPPIAKPVLQYTPCCSKASSTHARELYCIHCPPGCAIVVALSNPRSRLSEYQSWCPYATQTLQPLYLNCTHQHMQV